MDGVNVHLNSMMRQWDEREARRWRCRRKHLLELAGLVSGFVLTVWAMAAAVCWEGF